MQEREREREREGGRGTQGLRRRLARLRRFLQNSFPALRDIAEPEEGDDDRCDATQRGEKIR